MSLMLAALVHTTLAGQKLREEMKWWQSCPVGTEVRIYDVKRVPFLSGSEDLQNSTVTGTLVGDVRLMWKSKNDKTKVIGVKVKCTDGVKYRYIAPERLSLKEGTRFTLTGLTGRQEKYNEQKGTIYKWSMLQLHGTCNTCKGKSEAQKKNCGPCKGTGHKQEPQDPKQQITSMDGVSTDYYKVKMTDPKIDSKMKKDDFFKGFYGGPDGWVQKENLNLKVILPQTSLPPHSPRLEEAHGRRGDGRRRLSFSGRRLLARERRLRRLMSCM